METTDTIELWERALVFVAIAPKSKRGKAGLAEASGISRAWISSFLKHGDALRPETHERLKSALDDLEKSYANKLRNMPQDEILRVAIASLNAIFSVKHFPSDAKHERLREFGRLLAAKGFIDGKDLIKR